jgi:hypothetical protein
MGRECAMGSYGSGKSPVESIMIKPLGFIQRGKEDSILSSCILLRRKLNLINCFSFNYNATQLQIRKIIISNDGQEL